MRRELDQRAVSHGVDIVDQGNRVQTTSFNTDYWFVDILTKWRFSLANKNKHTLVFRLTI